MIIELSDTLPELERHWDKWSLKHLAEGQCNLWYFFLKEPEGQLDELCRDIARAVLSLKDPDQLRWCFESTNTDERNDVPAEAQISVAQTLETILPSPVCRAIMAEFGDICRARINLDISDRSAEARARAAFKDIYDEMMWSYTGMGQWISLPDHLSALPPKGRGHPRKVTASTIQKTAKAFDDYYLKHLDEDGSGGIPIRWRVPDDIWEKTAKDLGVHTGSLMRYHSKKFGGAPKPIGWQLLLETLRQIPLSSHA